MKESYNLSTQGMQDRGIHYMGNHIKHDVDPEALKLAQEKANKEQMEYVANLLAKDKDCKPFENKKIVPVSNRIVVLPYEKNPYRVPLHQRSSGLILGDFETGATYKSHETGEQEESQKGIWCCKVIAVGDECKNVIEGEDVYINFMIAAPLPFGGKGYYTISENNVICSIRNKE